MFGGFCLASSGFVGSFCRVGRMADKDSDLSCSDTGILGCPDKLSGNLECSESGREVGGTGKPLDGSETGNGKIGILLPSWNPCLEYPGAEEPEKLAEDDEELLGKPVEEAEELLEKPEEEAEELLGKPAEEAEESLGKPAEEAEELLGKPAEDTVLL